MKKSDNDGRATIRAYINLERVPVKRIRRVTLQLISRFSNLRLEYQVPDTLKMAMKEDYQIFKRESSEFLELFKSHWCQLVAAPTLRMQRLSKIVSDIIAF